MFDIDAFCFEFSAETKKATTPENAMRLPSVVPSAETASSEAERHEREALADMFSPSSPHGHIETMIDKTSLGNDQNSSFSNSNIDSQFGKDVDDSLKKDKGSYFNTSLILQSYRYLTRNRRHVKCNIKGIKIDYPNNT